MGSVCDLDRALHAFGQTTGRCQCGVMVLHYQGPSVPVVALRALVADWRRYPQPSQDMIDCAEELAALCDAAEKP